jgi:hypothetical protein
MTLSLGATLFTLLFLSFRFSSAFYIWAYCTGISIRALVGLNAYPLLLASALRDVGFTQATTDLARLVFGFACGSPF